MDAAERERRIQKAHAVFNEISDCRTTTIEESLDLFEELHAELESRIGGLRSDMERL